MINKHAVKFPSYARLLLSKSNIEKRYFANGTCLFCRKPSRPILSKIFTYEKSWSKSYGNISKLKEIGKERQVKHQPPIPVAEVFLEKLVAGLSGDIHQKHRVYKNDFMRVLSKVKELNFSTKKQSLLLLQCCTDLMPDEAPASREALAKQVWETIKPHTKFHVEHYNVLLGAYIANRSTLVANTFIKQMEPVKPNIITYELIVKALSEMGDINQATEVISNMKALSFPVTEKIFNSLIVCQATAGNIQEIITMMKSLKMEFTEDTYTAIARAHIISGDRKKFQGIMQNAQDEGIQFQEKHIMDIVRTLAVEEMDSAVPWVLKYLPKETLESPSISAYMQSVTTLLVFQNYPMVALEIYKCLPLPSFGPNDDKGLHGRSLVRDCVKASVPSTVIADTTQELMLSGRNPIALQNAAEIALQLGKVQLALDVFQQMKQHGMPVRPHYFWPILLIQCRNYGEKGIISTLKTMMKMETLPDYTTLMEYVLPNCSFTSPPNLAKKLIDTGLTVNAMLTPVMETLIKTGQLRAASELCELFQGKIYSDKLLTPLVQGYLINSDLKHAIHLLEDISLKTSDNTKDWTGRFLCSFIKISKGGNLQDFLIIVNALKSTTLRISMTACDYCRSLLPDGDKADEIRNLLIQITDDKLIDDGELFSQQITHPKNMDEESLKAHLIELEAKGMNTRGVLRKLLQQYLKSNDLTAAKQIVEKCQNEGVTLSAGMKAAVFDLYVKLGDLEQAELSLADLNKTAPNFPLDDYKVINFATLLVRQKKIDKAFEFITEQAKKRHIEGDRGMIMNCWRLLDATVSKGTPDKARRMFDILTSLRFCQPNNILLGPLVRMHLINNDLEAAVKEFISLSKKFKKTPLKHELLCKILQSMDNGKSEEEFLNPSSGRCYNMVQEVLNASKHVHGVGDMQISLIVAVADVGYKKTLRKLFLDPSVKFNPDALLRRCERFATIKKVDPLLNIVECASDLRHVDVVDYYDLILDVYDRDNDYENAVTLWRRMQDVDIRPSQRFARNFCSLAEANKKRPPTEMVLLTGKKTASGTAPDRVR